MTDVTEVVAEEKPTIAPEPGVAFFDLRPGQCKYPLGAATDPPRLFCGEPAQPGESYCPQCRSRAYTPRR